MRFENIRNISVIGSGTMGPGIALCFARHGYAVGVCDSREQALAAARPVLQASLSTLARHGLVQDGEIAAIEKRITFTTSLEAAAANADFLMECVTEDRAVKRAVMRELAGLCRRDAIFASNTSYLNIFELVPEDRLPNTVIAHWFAPPHILPLVEVVREAGTSQETANATVELLRRIGKTPIVMNKYVPGHAVNRLQRMIGREVFFLLDNGYITAEQLDLAVKASIAPRMMLLGVVQRYDFTGLDLSAANLRNEQYLEPPMDNEPRSLSSLVRHGHLGVKTGKGFYDYGGRSPASVLAERDDRLLDILECAGFCLEPASGERT